MFLGSITLERMLGCVKDMALRNRERSDEIRRIGKGKHHIESEASQVDMDTFRGWVIGIKETK